MSINIFCIAFMTMMAGMIVFLIINMSKVPVVKAGKVTKVCARNRMILGTSLKHGIVNGVEVDLRNDERMIVCGNSMQMYGISDGQQIYVKKISDDDKLRINTFPVVVFHIINGKPNDSEFKLRKFVGYVYNEDCDNIYDTYKNRIHISKERFIDQCSSKLKKYEGANSDSLVLSETFDEDKKEIVYSLHPASSIYGKVEYAI